MKYCPLCKRRYEPEAVSCRQDDTDLFDPAGAPDPYGFVGKVVNDRYEIEGLLGQGHFAAVYLAFQRGMERPVALKLLRPDLGSGAELSNGGDLKQWAAESFTTEARRTGRLSHGNVLAIYEAGETPGCGPYIAMEWVPGRTLEEELQRNGRLEFERAGWILQQVASALSAAHANHIIHRDLKPSNIMLGAGPDGTERVMLLDFGVSKIIPDGRLAEATENTQPAGNALYSAPEQWDPEDTISRAADVYSLGAVLFHMLAGRSPFGGRDVVNQHKSAPRPFVSKARAEAIVLDELIREMMAIDPEFRPGLQLAVCEYVRLTTPVDHWGRVLWMKAAVETPIPGAIVTLKCDWYTAECTQITGADGYFHFDKVVGGSEPEVTVEASGFQAFDGATLSSCKTTTVVLEPLRLTDSGPGLTCNHCGKDHPTDPELAYCSKCGVKIGDANDLKGVPPPRSGRRRLRELLPTLAGRLKNRVP